MTININVTDGSGAALGSATPESRRARTPRAAAGNPISPDMARKTVEALVEIDLATGVADIFASGASMHRDAWKTMSPPLVPAWRALRTELLAQKEKTQ